MIQQRGERHIRIIRSKAGIAKLLVVLATLLPAAGQQADTPLQDAAQALAAGNLQRAESELQTILRRSPKDYHALDLLGIVRAEQHRNNEAEELFKQVIGIRPDFASAHIHLGFLHEQMAHPEDAIDELQEGLRLDPARNDAANALVSIWRTQARAALLSNDPEKALSSLLHARKLAPNEPDVQFEFGMVALRMSLLPDAIEAFQETLKLRSDDAKAMYGLGRAYMEMAKFQDAHEQFQRYIDLRSEDATGHYALGMSCVALARPEEARKEFEKSISLSPAQTESYFRLGLLDLDSKDLDAASKRFLHVLERDPKHAGALAGMGRFRFEQKQYREAADYLQRSIASNDSLQEAHYYLGLTYARMGRKQESDEQLQIATRLEHEQTESQRTVFRILDSGLSAGSDSTPK